MADKKRVVVISDFHSGHVVGLTHPDFNPRYPIGTEKYIYAQERAKYWRFFADTVASLQPINLLVVNGDSIDGRGEASGGTELLTTDRSEQVEMAVAAIKECKAEKIWVAYGTAYHGGKEEDWEVKVADGVNAIKIGGEDFPSVNGLVFSCKHHIGRSESPMGRFTALARDRLWNVMWNEWQEYPKADVIIRSHVHYYNYCGGYGWMALSTPSLQGYGSKFGQRRMSGTVDFGLVSFDIVDKETWSWTPYILKSETAKKMMINI